MAGRFYYGKEEQVRCLQDVDIQGDHGELLCLGYKTTTVHFGAGIHLSDDGYVLAARTGVRDQYYPLDDATIRTHQSTGHLPSPLPAYTIPFGDYVWGHLVWIVVALSIGWGLLVRHRRARRRRHAVSLLRGDDAPSKGGPLLHTETDRLIRDRASAVLRPGERTLQQAYVVDRDVDSAGLIGALFARGLFAVLTSERIILFSTKRGSSNVESESIERGAIRAVDLDGNALVLDLADGSTKRLVIRVDDASVSNQRAFASEVPRRIVEWIAEAAKAAEAA